ncbi:MAG: TIGR02099 family protein [Gammaproteobacteria bacterium]|nr:TIGR02099 family protein [Gammaproteobacteria bacterium]
MKMFIRRMIKFFAYLAAGIVIMLAIAVGLFRLFLPRLPEYQEEIKGWASTAIGMQVEFSGMDARWGLSGPELEFYDAELIRPSNGVRAVAAQQVRIGIGLARFLYDRTLVVDRVVISESSFDIRQMEDGSLRIQGSPADELLNFHTAGARDSVSIDVIGENLELRFMQPGDERPRFFQIPRVRISADQNRIAADADIRLPDDLGGQVSLSATQVLSLPADERNWNVIVETDEVNLSGWSALLPNYPRISSGSGDLELALSIGGSGMSGVSAELELTDVALDGQARFDVEGHLELASSSDSWLIAANDFVFATGGRSWPKTNLRLEAGVDPDGSIELIDASATYLNLTDLQMLDPWLPEERRQQIDEYAPDGVVHNLVATLSGLTREQPQFNISAELDAIGVAGGTNRPGVRGFSGRLRADSAGGSIEIDSRDLVVTAPDYLAEDVQVQSADGLIIWRTSNNRTTILSDSIRIDSSVFDSESNVQIVLNGDGGAPEIDLSSTWSISDLAGAKRLIPLKVVKPKLYDWFQMALVSGSIPRGSTTLNGPLDKFPFDNGEGRLLINASVRNMNFKFHRDWPAAEQADMEVILDNARLYTVQNRSTSAGNTVVDARVDIPDLRDPVLEIESFSSSSLEAIHSYAQNSPIAKVFGGQLDRVSVSGDASFTLDLLVPIKRATEFEFESKIRSNSGQLAVAGFDAPITDLIGEVTIRRDEISSESLGGQFLGQAVSIDLLRSEDPQFSVVAHAESTLTADGVVNGLGIPMQGLLNGAAPYQARIWFPNGKAEVASPLTIQIDSELDGLALEFPAPLGKTANSQLQVASEIRFLPGGEIIESSGSAENRVAWQLAFNRPEEFWDLDRGVVTLGDGPMQEADTRGLHVRGNTPTLRLEEWLNLSRSGERKVGVAERIRSIDVLVDDLYLLGQHLRDHRARVDRSALDWLVQLDGEDVVGSVFVPYDFGGDREMVLEMQRLRLPGNDEDDDTDGTVDPRSLPPISLTADEFAFGDRYLGAVELVLEKNEVGLEATTIKSKDATFEIVGTGRWVADDADPLGSHSFVMASMTSTDVKTTMARLNYQPGITSDSMSMLFNLDWSGSPRAEFFDVLNGDVQVRLDDGQLEEVEPGAGRVFGLMSVVALPRRLSLDFRDVFSKGFGFDKIAGNFRIVNGRTYTCDLSLEGPAADIGIVGEANIADRTYSQTAVVTANVGNTLPIVGAVVAGPQVAAGLLIFSQIFKKPLQEVGQAYYGISGSWDEPVVDSSNSAAFVASGELAECLPGN